MIQNMSATTAAEGPAGSSVDSGPEHPADPRVMPPSWIARSARLGGMTEEDRTWRTPTSTRRAGARRAAGRRPATRTGPGPVFEEIISHKTESYVALFGHPLHAQTVHFPIALAFAVLGADVFYWYSADPFWLRAGLWAAGFAFVAGLAAGVFGTLELLLVKGIPGARGELDPRDSRDHPHRHPRHELGRALHRHREHAAHGLMLSILGAVFTGVAGWHGGKLVYDHGIGVMIDSKFTSSRK
jgi:uncharacterized membrane protein